MTRSPSTTSRAGSVMLEPTSPGSLSTVTTSSSATFSCRPPQRTIAYTRELSLSLGLFLALSCVPRNSGVTTAGSLERAQAPAQRATPDWQGYQTPAVSTNRPRSPDRRRASPTRHLPLSPGDLPPSPGDLPPSPGDLPPSPGD